MGLIQLVLFGPPSRLHFLDKIPHVPGSFSALELNSMRSVAFKSGFKALSNGNNGIIMKMTILWLRKHFSIISLG